MRLPPLILCLKFPPLLYTFIQLCNCVFEQIVYFLQISFLHKNSPYDNNAFFIVSHRGSISLQQPRWGMAHSVTVVYMKYLKPSGLEKKPSTLSSIMNRSV